MTPGSEAIKPTSEDAEGPLNEEQATEYRSFTCTLLYAAHDIVEAQHGVRNLTMDLKSPSAKSWERLKRMTRYLMGVLDGSLVREEERGADEEDAHQHGHRLGRVHEDSEVLWHDSDPWVDVSCTLNAQDRPSMHRAQARESSRATSVE